MVSNSSSKNCFKLKVSLKHQKVLVLLKFAQFCLLPNVYECKPLVDCFDLFVVATTGFKNFPDSQGKNVIVLTFFQRSKKLRGDSPPPPCFNNKIRVGRHGSNKQESRLYSNWRIFILELCNLLLLLLFFIYSQLSLFTVFL